MRREAGRSVNGGRKRFWMIALAAWGVPVVQGWMGGGMARGQTLYWDTNNATAGAGSGGMAPGTWGSGNTNWTTDSTGSSTTTTWTNGSTAVFAAGTDATGTYTVSVSGSQVIGGLVFQEGNVTLNQGTLMLNSNGVSANVAAGLSATINSGISGGGFDFTKLGTGTLSLNLSNTPTFGDWFVNAGTLNVASTITVHNYHLTDANGSLSGGTFTSTGTAFIGDGTLESTFTQTGGTFVPGTIILGWGGSSGGQYNLNGGVVSMGGGTMYVGSNGHGTVAQTGGSVNAGAVMVGQSGLGVYSLSGTGTLLTDALTVGFNGNATFNQNGGTATAAGMVIANQLGSTGVYNLSAGVLTDKGLNTAMIFQVGGTGTATFTQSGGQFSLGNHGQLQINSPSVYNLNGGTLSVAGGNVPIRGTLNINGGVMNISNGFGASVGLGGNGAVTQNNGSATLAGFLELGATSLDSGTWNLSAGTLSVNNGEYIGNGGAGTFTQSGGTNSITGNDLFIGDAAGSYGVYNLGGGVVSVQGANATVGASGAGTFTQTGGTLSCNNTLTLGQQVNSTGIYNLSGGLLSPSILTIGGGSGDVATLTQSIGTVTTNGLTIAANAGATGTYNLNSGNASIFGIARVGSHGAGTLIKSGGTNTISNDLRIAELAGSSGYYSLSGTGSLSIPNGTNLYVGEDGLGTFVQSGGSINLPAVTNVGGNMFLAYNADANGSYTLSGGTIAADGIVVGGQSGAPGGAATFTASGGTITLATGMHVWPTGRLTVSGGTINAITPSTSFSSGGVVNFSSGTIALSAMDNTGTFTQSGGALTVTPGTQVNSGQFSIGNPTTLGTYTISAGTASFDKIGVGGQSFATPGKGVMNVNGGTVTATTSLYVWDQPGSALNLAGGVLNVGTMDLNGNSSRFNWTSGTLGLTATGLTIQSGQLLGPNVVLNSSQTLNVSGGNELVGDNGAGTLSNSGSNTVNGSLRLGNGATGSGIYTLSGNGTVQADFESIGYNGVGTFTQNGGTNTVTAGTFHGLYIGDQSGSGGIYTLSAGVLSTPNSYVGNFAQGTFVQSGGTHSVTNSLNLAALPGSFGNYSLTGGLLSAGSIYVGGNSVGNGSSARLTVEPGATLTTSGVFNPWNTITTVITFNSSAISLGSLAGNGFITLNGSMNVGTDNSNSTYSGGLGSTGSVLKTGAGTLVLSGTNNLFTGPFSVSGGTLQVTSAAGAGTTAGSGNITLTNGGVFSNSNSGAGVAFLDPNRTISIGSGGGTLDVPNSSAILLYTTRTNNTAGTISGSGQVLTKSGAGTLRLSDTTASPSLSVSNNTAKLIVLGGIVQGGLDGVFGAVPTTSTPDAITLNGGGIGMNSTQTTNVNRGITIGAAGGTLQAPSNWTVGGPITGGGTITKNGANILSLQNPNGTFSGKYVITQGELSGGSNDLNFGPVPTMFVSDYFTLNGSTAGLRATAAFLLQPNRGITLGSGGGSIDVAAGTLTYSGVISATTNTAGLTKIGAQTLLLNGVNTFGGGAGGDLTLAVGSIAFGVDNSAGLGNIVSTPTGTGVVTLKNNSALSVTLGNNIVINPGAGAILDITATNGNTLNLNGVISGGAPWTRGNASSGAGNVVLGGNAPNTFTGSLQVLNGSLIVAKNGGLGQASSVIVGGTNGTLGFQGNLNYTNFPSTIQVSGVGSTSANRGAIHNFSGDNTFNGGITMTSDVRFGATTGSLVLTGPVTGAFNVSMSGSGTVAFAASNNYSGTTTISGGTIEVRANNALGTVANGTTVASGATLAFANNVNYTALESLTVNGSVALRNRNGDNSFAGEITLNSDSTFTADNGSLTFNGGIHKNGFNVHFAGPGTHNINGVIDGIADVFIDGSGTTNFKNANTYVGPTSVTAGTLALRNPNAIPNNSNVSVSAPGTLLLFNTPTTLTGTVNNAGQISLNNVTLNFNNNVTNTGNINVPAGSTVNFNANYSQTGSGAIGGAGDFFVPGAINYNGPTNHPIASVDNPVLAVWSGTGAISIAANSNFNDAGSFSAGADQVFAASSGNASFTIPVGGSLNRGGSSNGTTTFASNISLTNSGLVSASAGTLKFLGSGIHNGTFATAANSTIEFAGANTTLSAGNSAATGSGTLLASAGNLTAPALKVDNYTLAITNTANVTVNSSTILGGSNGNTASLNQSGGTSSLGVLALGNNGSLTSGGGVGHATVSNSTLHAMTLLMGSSQGGSADMAVNAGGHVVIGGGAAVTTLTVTDGFFEVLNQTAPAGEDVNLNRALVAGYQNDGAIFVGGAGGQISSPNIKLGIATGRTGTFTQNGGSVSIVGDAVNGPGIFSAGNNADVNSNSANSGTGHISITAGSLYADTVILGSPNGGQGDMTISGNATVTIGGGVKANALIMNGGSLTVRNQDMPGEDPVLNRAIVGGYLNDGSVTVNAGTVFTPKIKLGVSTSKVGSYTQIGGDVHIVGDATNGPGVFGGGNDGSLTSGSGVGHANISGGTFYADTILLGSTAGGQADFNVSGTAQITVGGGVKANSINMNGGTLTVLNANPPTGEDPVLNRAIVGGYMTDGSINMNAGSMFSPKIKLGVSTGKVGNYTQIGGDVHIVGDNTNGPGTFGGGNDGTLTGGTGVGHATISGGTFYADTILLGSTAGGQGDLTVSGSAQVTVGGGVKANSVTVNGGSFTVLDQNPVTGEDAVLNRSIVAGYMTDGLVTVNSGTVISPNIKLGITSGKSGTYAQSNGSVTVTNFGIGNDPLLATASGNGHATISGGSLSASSIVLGSTAGGANGDLTISGTASVTSSSTQVTALGTIALNGGSLNAGALQIQAGGSFTQAGGSLSMASLSNAGTFAFNGGNLTQTGAVMSLGNLSLTGSKNYSMVSGRNKALLLSSLTIGAGNTLDVNDDAVIVNYGSETTHATRDAIRNLLKNGRNAGPASAAPWNGLGGIVSTYAHNTGNGFNLAIGYADNTDLAAVRASGSYTVFGGQTVASNTILVQLTRGADATMDGIVDGQDVAIIGTHFQKPGSGQWCFGDFDYSGTCDGSDVAVLGTTFGKTSPVLSPAQMTAEFGSAFTSAFEAGIGGSGAVPEPAGLTLFGLGGVALMSRQRRKKGSERR